MQLNNEQRAAIDHETSTVVLAGPGSGKTHTLVEKICNLLQGEVTKPQGVACLTFSREAAAELARRLRERGHRPDRYLYLGTVHSFCLNRVIRPYAHLIGKGELRNRTVLAPTGQLKLRQQALDAFGVQEPAQYFDTTLTKIRRDRICEDDLSSYDPQHVKVAKRYEKLLRNAGLIDFDAMTFEALRIIERNGSIADLIVSRFPWIAVDEYQDLGGVLHRIVMALRSADANVFAVGDPDQCVYEFAGAKPLTLRELVEASNFHTIRFRYNYRSGRKLMDAASVALNEVRDYEPDPERVDLGEVLLYKCEDGLSAHARAITDYTIPALIEDGVPLHEIAVLYPGKGPILNALTAALEGADIPFRMERESSFPSDPIVRWLQECASYALKGAASSAVALGDLMFPLLSLASDAGSLHEQNELMTRAALVAALDEPAAPDDRLIQWLENFVNQLNLYRLLHDAGRVDEKETLEKFCVATDTDTSPATLFDFADRSIGEDKVVVTTYHSSKGRQFDIVLLPGLQDTLVPRTRWNHARRELEITNLAEERRLFYVALTRARRSAVLYYSESFVNKNGYRVKEHSKFIDEIAEQFDIIP